MEEFEWVPANEDFPLTAPGCIRVSENLELLLKDQSTVIGFFQTEDEEWYNYDAAKKILFEDVVGWRSIAGEVRQ